MDAKSALSPAGVRGSLAQTPYGLQSRQRDALKAFVELVFCLERASWRMVESKKPQALLPDKKARF